MQIKLNVDMEQLLDDGTIRNFNCKNRFRVDNGSEIEYSGAQFVSCIFVRTFILSPQAMWRMHFVSEKVQLCVDKSRHLSGNAQ